MVSRPKLKIELSRADKALEAFTLILLIFLWTGTVVGYSKLPDQIPTHFNARGEADAFGNKSKIFILPIIASILYIAITVLNKHPHLYNYPSTINPENASRMYTSATKVIRLIKVVVIFIFTMIVAMTYRSAFNNHSGLGWFFLPACILLMVLPSLYFIRQGRKKIQ